METKSFVDFSNFLLCPSLPPQAAGTSSESRCSIGGATTLASAALAGTRYFGISFSFFSLCDVSFPKQKFSHELENHKKMFKACKCLKTH